MSKQDPITVFEHDSVFADGGVKSISADQLHALQVYFGNGVPYFSLINNGVKFNEYVGVIQVGNTVIEVLPKADKNSVGRSEEDSWRQILIGMLRAVYGFEIKVTSNSTLRIKTNHILDLYFELFIKEVEYLLHSGLVKKYKRVEGNVPALKGNLHFTKHIQKNLTHQERFYVRSSTYDVCHPLHQILYKTICLLKQINRNANLHGRIGLLFLLFPEMPDIKVTEATFSKITLNRKTHQYKNALDIAKMLLLNFHPDIRKGRNDVLALMFDMNKLWEQFVYVSLRKNKTLTVTAQTSKHFWQPESGIKSSIRADILINSGEDNCLVLDTKWKNLNGYNPSLEDLRQMYVYHEFYGAKKVALVYPGEKRIQSGKFLDPISTIEMDKECSIISIPIDKNIRDWQNSIFFQFVEWQNKLT